MSEMHEDGPPEPPFEAADDPVDEPTGTVRERVRQVLSSLSDPAKVSTIAEMADCSAEGARKALREYAEMGLVIKTNDNPETYERNPAYFQFLRGHRLAQQYTTEELRKKIVEKYGQHRSFATRFDADTPEEVNVDERESRERFEEVFEWEALLSEADDLREAYRQQTGTMLPSLENLPIDESSADADNISFSAQDSTPNIDPLQLIAFAGSDVPTLLSIAQQHQELIESIQDNLDKLADPHQMTFTDMEQ